MDILNISSVLEDKVLSFLNLEFKYDYDKYDYDIKNLFNENKILLDCTFRDGGYYNKWHFDLKLFNEYIKCMYECKIDIIELGFRFSSKNSFLGNFAYSTEDFLNKLVLPKKLKYAVMINAKEFYHKEKSLLKLFKPKKSSKINIVRIAINFNEFKRSKKIIKILNDLNYEVGLNLMQAHDRTKEEISNVLSEIKSWSVIIDYLYFADSLGCMDNEYVKKITENFFDDWNVHIGIPLIIINLWLYQIRLVF